MLLTRPKATNETTRLLTSQLVKPCDAVVFHTTSKEMVIRVISKMSVETIDLEDTERIVPGIGKHVL